MTLNLPRAAYVAQTIGDLPGELARLVALAAQAHAEKRAFLESLVEQGDLGPWAKVRFAHGGRPYFDLDRADYVVGMTGLNECVEHLTGGDSRNDDDAREAAAYLVAELDRLCVHEGEPRGLRLRLDATQDPDVARRLAAIDLGSHREPARAMVKTDPMTWDLMYTAGVALPASLEITPVERGQIEGALHPESAPTAALTLALAPASEFAIAMRPKRFRPMT